MLFCLSYEVGIPLKEIPQNKLLKDPVEQFIQTLVNHKRLDDAINRIGAENIADLATKLNNHNFFEDLTYGQSSFHFILEVVNDNMGDGNPMIIAYEIAEPDGSSYFIGFQGEYSSWNGSQLGGMQYCYFTTKTVSEVHFISN